MPDPDPSQSVRYRPMNLVDVGDVHRLDELSFSLPWPERSFRYEVTQNEQAVAWVCEIVLEDHRVIAGMIVAWLVIDEVHIGTIAVHPEHRRLGIGRQLVARVLAICVARGARTAYLEVRRSNLPAQALYLQMGFEIVGVRRRYYHDNNEDALLMTLDHLDRVNLQELIK
jgi:ribosomal-protein-alanine N-acetyltransferase